MDDLNSLILTLAFIFGIFQLEGFLIDLIKWAVRRKHPAYIRKSEDGIKQVSQSTRTINRKDEYIHEEI